MFLTYRTYAKYPGMAAIRAQQCQQFMNQQMRTMNNLMLMTHIGYNSYKQSEYQVQYKGNTIKNVTSPMFYDTLSHKSFIIYVNEEIPKSAPLHRNEKIYPENTLKVSLPYSIERNGERVDIDIEGIPNDTCWVFKVLGGSISLYGKTTDYLSYSSSPYGKGPEIIPSRIVGIQLNDGPILKYNLENLTKFMADNQKCIQLLQNKKFFKAINRYNADKLKETKK